MSRYRPDEHGQAVPVCMSCTWDKRFDDMARRVDTLVDQANAMDIQYRRLAAENAKLRKERDEALQQTDMAEPAKEVYEYWRDVIEGGSKRIRFTAKRSKCVQARLNEGRTVDELKLAIDGAKLGAWIDEKGVKHDDLELICRDDGKVRRFLQIARAHRLRAQREQDELRRTLLALYGEGGARVQETPRFGMTERWPCPQCDYSDALEPPLTLCITPADGFAVCMRCKCERAELSRFAIDALRRKNMRAA